MRMIDADALIEDLFIKFGNQLPDGLCREIDNAPTINLAVPIHIKNLTAEEKETLIKGFTRNGLATFELYDERPQGEWLEFITPLPVSDNHYKIGVICSKCNTTWDCPTNYCPYCGADMRGKNNV
jgi:hypothetical protein